MSDISGGEPGEAGWYDLFSRGARDWLRHNDKVRDAVRQHLPQIVAGADVLSGGASTVRVPVRMLEHYRFRCATRNEQQGVGQGQAKPGDRIGRAAAGRARTSAARAATRTAASSTRSNSGSTTSSTGCGKR